MAKLALNRQHQFARPATAAQGFCQRNFNKKTSDSGANRAKRNRNFTGASSHVLYKRKRRRSNDDLEKSAGQRTDERRSLSFTRQYTSTARRLRDRKSVV